MSDPKRTVRESELIDDVIDWLRKEDFSCMETRHVSWDATGTRGTAAHQATVTERFAIECDGDCTGVRYTPRVDGIITHFGTSRPAPVLQIKSVWFGGSAFRWEFTRPAASPPPPDIYIHRWTGGKFNNADGCKPPKTNNR